MESFWTTLCNWFAEFIGDPTAVFTFALFAVTLLLFFATRGLVKSAERTAVRQLRAYVFCNNVTFVDSGRLAQAADQMNRGELKTMLPRLSAPNIPVALISIRNSGQTPAYGLAHFAYIDVMETRVEHAINIPEIPANAPRNPLGAGAEATKNLDRGPLTQQDIADILTATRAIYVFGRIDYRDAFGRNRWSTYKLRYTGVYPPVDFPTLTYCDTGNEADEEH